MTTLPADRDSEPKHAKVQIADFSRAGGTVTAPEARGRQLSELGVSDRNDEMQQLKIALLHARDDQVRDIRAHITQLAGLQSTLSDTEQARQAAQQENLHLQDKAARLQAELNTAGEALAELTEDSLAKKREISKLITRLQETQRHLESAFTSLAEQRQRSEQQVSRSEDQLAGLRARLTDSDRDLSRELAVRDRLAQDLAVARRNYELVGRTLRVVTQLGEIAARTSPVTSEGDESASRRQTRSALRLIREIAKSGTSFLSLERLRRAIGRSGLFDAAWYRSQRPDLAGEQDVLAHFILYGINEGTSPSPLIDVDWIAKSTGGGRAEALRDYLLHGRYTDCRPTPLFDVNHYRARAGLGGSADALSHYLRHGRAAGLSPHPLFDRSFYNSQLPKPAHKAVDAFLHYVLCPFELDPHPLFSTEYYLSQHPELRTAGISPLLHYVEYGFREKTSPHRRFSGPAYLSRHTDVAAAGLNPLVHYVMFGQAEGRRIDPAG